MATKKDDSEQQDVTPVGDALKGGPTQDDLNPAYAADRPEDDSADTADDDNK